MLNFPLFDPNTEQCAAVAAAAPSTRRLSELPTSPVGGAVCESNSTTGTEADHEVCEVVALDLADNRLAGALNLSRLCELPHLAKLDVSNSAGCEEAGDCNTITAIEGDCRLSGLAHLNLARNNLAGDFPFAALDFDVLESLDIEDNKFTYPETPEGERALDLLVTRCSGGVACKGLPPGSCDAFGGEGDTYYKPRVDDPNKCLRCEGQMKALILIVCACVGMFVMLILYILLILKFKFNLKRWVSTASIFFTHMQTISIFGNLHLHWPPPVEAVTGIATLSVFENTEMFRPECLVEQQHKVSTFYLFSIIIAGGILVVLAGSFTVAQLLYLLRRCIYGRPASNFTPAASLAVQSFKEVASHKERASRASQAASPSARASGYDLAGSPSARASMLEDQHRGGGGATPPPLPPIFSGELPKGLSAKSRNTSGKSVTLAEPPAAGTGGAPRNSVNLKGAKLDNALDSVCFVQTVFFSMQVATAWRVSLKLLAKSASNDDFAYYGSGAAAALLLIELGFMGYFYLAIRHRRWVQSVLQISEARIIRRVDYVTDRFSDDVPWWQLAVWARQVCLTITIHLPDLLAQSGSEDYARPVTWVHAGLALIILVVCWVWHHRIQPYEFSFQNKLEWWLYFSDVAVVLLAALYTVLALPEFGISRVAIDVIGWVMFTVLVGAIVAAAAWLVYSWCKGRLRNEELYADENRAVNQRSSNVSGGGTMRDLFFGGAGPSFPTGGGGGPLGGGPRLQLGYNGEAADVPARNSIVGAAKARLSRRWGSEHLKRHLAGRKPPTAGNILREGTTPPAWQNKAPSTCCRNSEHAVSEQI